MFELNREYLVREYRKYNLINRTEIDISDSGLETIDSKTFRGLTKLEKLYLSHNAIEEIDVRLFETLSNLKELKLGINKLKRIASNTFKGLNNLEKLDLFYNEIEEIEDRSFESLSNLKELDLGTNKLKRIDSNTFKGLDKLEILILVGNEIEKIDVRLFETLSNLKKLNLGNNNLKIIDSDTFKGFDKLEDLDLQCNEIEEIDVRSFESLSNLKYINLYSNKLKIIDLMTFKELNKLEILTLENNEIEKIDVRSFETLSNLEQLELSNNKLKRIDSNILKGFDKLRRLVLDCNEIEEIDVRSFESLSNLEQLYLSNNKLKRIDSNTFNGLTKLETLWLNNNEIEEISVRSFESLTNLEKLELSNNKLQEIDPKCFEPLRSIEAIQIYENVGLNALSFIKPSTPKYLYDREKVQKYGSISEWNQFLQQFSQQEKDEKEREQREAFDRLKIDEETKGRAQQEQENVKVPLSSSSSNLSEPIKEEAGEIIDAYIGKILNDRYKVERKLGKGTFGLVFLVDDTKIDIETVKKKAMKIMDQLDPVTENELDLFIETIHENIVRYFDHFHKRIGGENKTSHHHQQSLNFARKIDDTKRLGSNFEDKQILDWIRQATNALSYLHSREPDPIIHRDIKPENMFLSGKNEIKLGDLGISKLMENTHASTYAGTPVYMSPEVFKAKFMDTAYYPNTDVWSLGCVLFELKFLTLAFPNGQRNNPQIPTQVSSSGIFSSILLKMLEKDCLERITSQQLFAELLNL